MTANKRILAASLALITGLALTGCDDPQEEDSPGPAENSVQQDGGDAGGDTQEDGANQGDDEADDTGDDEGEGLGDDDSDTDPGDADDSPGTDD